MHVIPAHQGRPTDDPIFALNREATTRAKAGESIINATLGAAMDDSGKLAILKTAVQAVREVGEETFAGYAPITGAPAFNNAVMDDLFGDEPELRAAAIAAATPGGTGALRHAVCNFLEPGQALLTTNYFWGPYQTIADEADRKVETFEMFAADGTFDVGALDAAIDRQLSTQKRVLLFLNDPCHNPTGFSMHGDEWRKVAEVLAKHASSGRGSVTLLCDTAYTAYSAGHPRAFLKELRPLLGKVALLFAWSASKTYTMYGLRVGAIVACIADEAERKATEAAFAYSCRGTWSNCNHGGLAAVTRLLTDPGLRSACDAERSVLKDTLFKRVAAFNRAAAPAQLKYPRYEGGFFVTVFAPDAAERAVRMKEKGVFVVPQKAALRVALCSVREADVERLVDALKS